MSKTIIGKTIFKNSFANNRFAYDFITKAISKTIAGKTIKRMFFAKTMSKAISGRTILKIILPTNYSALLVAAMAAQ